jgi:hypothetical protein
LQMRAKGEQTHRVVSASRFAYILTSSTSRKTAVPASSRSWMMVGFAAPGKRNRRIGGAQCSSRNRLSGVWNSGLQYDCCCCATSGSCGGSEARCLARSSSRSNVTVAIKFRLVTGFATATYWSFARTSSRPTNQTSHVSTVARNPISAWRMVWSSLERIRKQQHGAFGIMAPNPPSPPPPP